MKGKYTISITARKAEYVLELTRKITVIKGQSGTGKSSILRLLRDFLELGKGSGVRVSQSKDARLVVLQNSSPWEKLLEELTGAIVFLDEDVRYLYSEAFQKALWHADVYAVIVSRSGLFTALPYAVKSIYGLRTEKRDRATLTRMYELYEERHAEGDFESVLTEDSGSGLDMARLAFGDCAKSAGGNAGVLPSMLKDSSRSLCVIVDGAAFGGFIEPVLKAAALKGCALIAAPESFEFLLLSLTAVKKYLADELVRTYDYCDSREYISYERYYTALLENITAEHLGFVYTKSKLPAYFANEKCAGEYMRGICKSFLKRI